MCSHDQAKGGQELDGQAVGVCAGIHPHRAMRREHSGFTIVQ